MKRVHLFELEDQPWFPAVLRDAGTAYLQFVMKASGQSLLLAGPVGKALAKAGTDHIVDLCSGGSGPIVPIVEALAAEGRPVTVELTDAFPNHAAFEASAKGSQGRIRFVSTPVDATKVPAGMKGFRTLFNAFHHFRPDAARAILQAAVDARQPIGIFEVASRQPLMMLGIAFSPLAVLLTMPLLRVRPLAFVFTYLVPIIPLFVLWDGLVSCLRTYSEPELRALVATVNAPDWEWEIGRVPLSKAPIFGTYLVGRDLRACARSSP